MAGIIADHNIEGHLVVLLRIWTSNAWGSLWESLALEVESFEQLGLPYDVSDRELWQVCQQHNIVLITANRNDEGPDSLEATIRDLNEPSSLAEYSNRVHPLFAVSDGGSALAVDYSRRLTSIRHNVRAGR
jgi:Domain of unknown function (DUF5615)